MSACSMVPASFSSSMYESHELIQRHLSSVRTRAELLSTTCFACADSGPRGLVLGSFCYWVCSSPVPCLALYHLRMTLTGSILGVLLWPSSVSGKHQAGEQGTSRACCHDSPRRHRCGPNSSPPHEACRVSR